MKKFDENFQTFLFTNSRNFESLQILQFNYILKKKLQIIKKKIQSNPLKKINNTKLLVKNIKISDIHRF